MTPKEKAEQLREKCDGYACYAEVAVDEILAIVDEEEQYILYKYWKEVKKEIEKL